MRRCDFCEQPVVEAARECPHCGAALPMAPDARSDAPFGDSVPSAPIDPEVAEWQREIVALVAQGRKIEAIRIYRERTGVGLAEAKSVVDALGARGTAPGMALNDAGGESAAGEAELLELLRQGRKIQAIKVYREQAGSDLRTAKEAVEALAARHGIDVRRAGCLGMLALGVGIGAGIAAMVSRL